MRDWNRLIVGDAFKLPSRDIYRIYGFKLAACAIIAIALAKERLVLIAAGAGYVAIRLAVALAFTQDWRTYSVGFLLSAGIALTALRLRKDRKPSYERPAKTNVVGLVMVVAGIGTAVAVGLWLKP